MKKNLKAASIEVLIQQNGQRWYKEKMSIEPFGFADGISQPLFYQYQINCAKDRGINQWDPSARLDLVLVKDPNGGEDSYGSFVVYRKLEQDVVGFKKRLEELAVKLNVSSEIVGAYAVGRFKDGTPLVTQLTSGNPHDNFNSDDDPDGSKCPFHAHIRKVNPRGGSYTLQEEERRHRIVRRSIPYGNQDEIGKKPVGLLFLCFQADLAQQFEFLQTKGANAPHAVRKNTGLDPLIGRAQPRPEGLRGPSGQCWPWSWGDAEAGTVKDSIANFVTLKGGEYFFAPSVKFLQGL